MTYFDTDMEIKDRKRLVLSDFKGIDTANPVFNVDKKRATHMRNFISINGSNHKRPGWRQIASFKDGAGNDLAINGCFSFKLYGEDFKIIYAGTTFYIYNDNSGAYEAMLPKIDNNVDTRLLKNQKVEMFLNDNKAYFIGCGDFLVLGKYNGNFEFHRVYNDENTYIPRTTTNISPIEAEFDSNNRPIVYAERQTDRDVNVLTRYRVNELISSQTASESAPRTYQLDADNIDQDFISITVNDYSGGDLKSITLVDSRDTRVQERSVELGDNLYSESPFHSGWQRNKIKFIAESLGTLKTHKGSNIISVNRGEYRVYFEPLKKVVLGFPSEDWDTVYFYSMRNGNVRRIFTATRSSALQRYSIEWEEGGDTATFDAYAKVTELVEIDGLDIIGYNLWDSGGKLKQLRNNGDIEWGSIKYSSGQITLTKAAAPKNGIPNIIVKFAKTNESASKQILNCSFGTYFGIHGNTNTLFLSGNANYKHCDYWSAPEDFTYFPSGNKCYVGTENSELMGYLRLGDDSLAILKSDNKLEPSLYIRTGIAASQNESGIVTDGYFVTSGKYVSNGAVSREAIKMFADDPIFLSPSGIYAISLENASVAVEQRVTRERSRFIDKLITSHKDLSKAVAVVYDNRYYLAIDGKIYVADARYKSSERADMPDTFNYEWWLWDHCPVYRFFEINGQLCFGTEDGRLCVFDSEYTDREYDELTYTASGTQITVEDNGQYDLTAIKEVYFEGDVYRVLLASSEFEIVDNQLRIIEESSLAKIQEGLKVYISDGGNISACYIADLDYGEMLFSLRYANDNQFIPYAGMRLLASVDKEILKAEYCVDENDERYLQVKNKADGSLYDIAVCNNAQAKLFWYRGNNVVAEWISPDFDMGANDYVKQLLELTIATEQITNGKVVFGYETKNRTQRMLIAAKGIDTFDFNTINFSKFAFDVGFSSSYTRKVKANFNYIRFLILSDNDCDCCVYGLTAVYKINRKNKGVY